MVLQAALETFGEIVRTTSLATVPLARQSKLTAAGTSHKFVRFVDAAAAAAAVFAGEVALTEPPSANGKCTPATVERASIRAVRLSAPPHPTWSGRR